MEDLVSEFFTFDYCRFARFGDKSLFLNGIDELARNVLMMRRATQDKLNRRNK
jgi:hypothetical protein